MTFWSRTFKHRGRGCGGGVGGRTFRTSFPRGRESIASGLDSRLRGNDEWSSDSRQREWVVAWIPACAGMTGGRSMRGAPEILERLGMAAYNGSSLKAVSK